MSAETNPAACHSRHERTGLVTNQDPDQPYDRNEPHASAAVCHREACQKKFISKVAGQTNRTSRYYDDAERRARKAEAQESSVGAAASIRAHYDPESGRIDNWTDRA